MQKAFLTRNGGYRYCSRAEFERWQMPYGKWTCADGREVLFDRDYAPICQRLAGNVSTADPKEWVPWTKQEWFYDDGDTEKKKRSAAETILKDWGYFDSCEKEIIGLLATRKKL